MPRPLVLGKTIEIHMLHSKIIDSVHVYFFSHHGWWMLMTTESQGTYRLQKTEASRVQQQQHLFLPPNEAHSALLMRCCDHSQNRNWVRSSHRKISKKTLGELCSVPLRPRFQSSYHGIFVKYEHCIAMTLSLGTPRPHARVIIHRTWSRENSHLSMKLIQRVWWSMIISIYPPFISHFSVSRIFPWNQW